MTPNVSTFLINIKIALGKWSTFARGDFLRVFVIYRNQRCGNLASKKLLTIKTVRQTLKSACNRKMNLENIIPTSKLLILSIWLSNKINMMSL